jgi:hypothetical protein
MDRDKKPQILGRTEYVVANLEGVKNPMEFIGAERLARQRLKELGEIVKGLSSKWIKKKSDDQMIDQTKAEMGRIQKILEEKRSMFGKI